MRALLFCIFLLLVFQSRSFGQLTFDGRVVNGSCTDLKFDELVRTLEASSDYYFYYTKADTDSVRITAQVRNQPLTNFLTEVLRETDLKFAIDTRHHVFITKERPIITSLPIGVFEVDQDVDTSISYSFHDREITARLLSTAENKVYDIGVKTYRIREGVATVSGYVRNIVTGEPVVGAAVFIEKPSIGVATDALGYYTLTLPRGRHTLKVRSVGMREGHRQIVLYSNGKLNIELIENIVALKEIQVKSDLDATVASNQMGVSKLTITTMKQVPTAFGETDALRVVLTLPGVKSVGESSTGLNVRGGSTDQNLILFNDATVYNPSHLFGFFSAFNPDILKEIELYKSDMPARLGGRLSSVLDISTREGNKKKFAGSGGIGLLTGRLTLEGPLIKERTSLMVSGRSSYSNWLLKQVSDVRYNQSRASFYDVNVQVNHEINQRNSLTLTGYLSNDQFKFNSDTVYRYQSQLAALKWKRIFHPKLFGTFTASYSRYRYDIQGDQFPENAYQLKFGIRQYNVKADMSYIPNTRHTMDMGISSILYKVYPGSFFPKGEASLVMPEEVQPEQGLETALYFSERYDITPKLAITGGLRVSMFQYLGPKQVAQYAENLPFDKQYITGFRSYGSGAIIQHYMGPEYRFSLRYMPTPTLSVKAGFNTTRQYIQMLSNTAAISPTDVWKLSDPYLKPQQGTQYSLGVYKNLRAGVIELSVEGYYKDLKNVLDYKSGDSLILNKQIETAVISTIGQAYGVEVLLKKLRGKLNGWASYTYSRTLLRASDPSLPDAPNRGKFYPANYDKPHDFSLISNYKVNRRLSFSFNFTYSTGRPYTPPVGKYVMDGVVRPYYADRNQNRIPDYIRADFGINIEGNHRVRKLAHSSWTLSVYNLLGRKNPYSVYFVTENGKINGYQLSIFGQPIPSITYNFKF
ncbi:TonB-dependent receptor [Siphonobacter curvatus]|uniref:TonB-dependent receptor n=1 Tax=Siphonobacter curvatus TaxID=2094562 RepID=A0A2S7IRS0_9BACT|nr:TonB-dependent receptor [Siphonobacter curvatus]PQA60369.1 TonB-dependent receptor [Siphonobacter curvatus]